MKGTVFAAFVAFCVSTAVFGQTSTVYLQNQESSDFHFVVDPKGLEGLTPGSPQLATRVAAFFGEQGDTPALSTLASGAEVKLESLSDGPHLLVGFFATEDQDDFPVRVMTLQADSRIGERFYAVFASPAQLSVPRGVGRLAQFARPAQQQGQQTAGAVAAAGTEAPGATAATSTGTASQESPRAPLQTLLQFSSTYAPESFTREQAGELAVLPISQSRAWTLTGTRVASISAVEDGKGLRLGLSAPGGFSESVSYFFYVFTSRTIGTRNAVTLELEPRASGSRGACLLWKKGAAAPTLIGAVTTTDTTVEVDIGAADIAGQLLGEGAAGISVDMTAGWYDHALGTWEEFYYTTFSSDVVPVIR